jgi:general secretion pathway protein G
VTKNKESMMLKLFEVINSLTNITKRRDQKEINSSPSEAGFSLIEILVALTLLGIAGTFVAGKIFESFEEGKRKAAIIQMSNLKANLKEFRRKCGFYPSQADGLNALVQAPTGKECKNYPPEGFLEDGVLPLDPWDMDFIYEYEGTGSPEIISSGTDLEIGTEDDLSSKKKKREQ